MVTINKRGQAAGAAVFLAVVAGLLIGFIILIPPAERAELLGEDVEVDDPDTEDEDIEEAVPEANLLTVSPGRIDYLSQKEVEHPLPVVNIYTKTESKILAQKNIVYAKKGAFSEELSTFPFNIPDLANTENLLLNFNVNEIKGELIIEFNDETIYKSEVQEGQSINVELPANLLKEENLLTFKPSSIGVAFWATHEVNLESIKVVADVTSVEAQSSKNIFLVSEIEKKNLERVTLKFQPECQFTEVGKLDVLINGKEIYSAVPDCELAMIPIEVSPELIFQGENEIIFRTSSGTYILSHVVIQSELKELEYPTYYFDVSYEQYEDVMSDKRRIRLDMEFVDVVVSKYGEIVFNGHTKHFDTKEVEYVIDLSDDLVQGTNALKVKPKKTLDVREIKIDLVK